MTLDEAVESFDGCATDKACADLLRAATEYWQDDMINDSTYANIVERVAEWLADE